MCPLTIGGLFHVIHLPNTFQPCWQFWLRRCLHVVTLTLSNNGMHNSLWICNEWGLTLSRWDLASFFMGIHRSLYIDWYVRRRATALSRSSSPITITRSRWHATQMLAAQNQPNKLIISRSASSTVCLDHSSQPRLLNILSTNHLHYVNIVSHCHA